MNLSTDRVRQRLKAFDFPALFTQELGWDRHTGSLGVKIAGQDYTLRSLAQKRSVQIFECLPGADGRIPDYATRRKIEKDVTRSAYEHLIIFTDAARSTQIWQWVARTPGEPALYREHPYHPAHQSGDALIQKLSQISIPLSEEEAIDLTGAVHKLRDAFDREKVTKKFYERFKTEHGKFLEFIKGIKEQGDKEWYASLMLNRLMFVYFIQQRGFLDGNQKYLQDRLQKVQARKGKGKFHTFYGYFLLKLFQDGFGKREADRQLDPELTGLIGKVPYLNGGLFDLHEIEVRNTDIEIKDEAFERLFEFFDEFDWVLDTRPIATQKEINPDLLGYIFEKYINQKQMGAYYTKEDITDYISKNTIIPYLLDAAKRKCAVAFEPGSALWRLLSEDPDRYIYPAVLKGVIDTDVGCGAGIIPLPPEIEKGIADVSQRGGWNKPAAEKYALPTETWREHVARRQRCLELREKLKAGEIHEINDLITWNLNIRQFAEDILVSCEGPELLRAMWHAIRDVTVLDPTCGSGAFLFAALNILQPLYEAALERMQAFVEDLARLGEKPGKKFEDFRKLLAEMESHPSRAYFIYKSIIVRNLYGVDIMEEAVEICKLRLFLKLVAQVEPDAARENFGMEPLPDIDFNIRAGNTLVGFATLADVKKTMLGKLADKALQKEVDGIVEEAEIVDKAFRRFHEMQTEHGMNARDFATAKEQLRHRLAGLTSKLNKFLAAEYGKNPANAKEYADWLKSHQPFHWFAEFYGIMKSGGFDVIIGNPPYLESNQIDYEPKGLSTADSKAVHAMCVERSLHALNPNGAIAMIVPLALVCTQRMAPLQSLVEAKRTAWFANFAWRPGKLFDTVNRALTIFVAGPGDSKTFSTNYQKWTSETRSDVFPCISFMPVPRSRGSFWIPKLGQRIELAILEKAMKSRTRVSDFLSRDSNHVFFYRTTGGLYWKVFTDFAPAFRINGKAGSSSRETSMGVGNSRWIRPLIAVLSSDFFWWYYTVASNLRDLNPSDIQGFPLPSTALDDPKLQALGEKYLSELKKNSTMLVREQKQTGRTETQSFKIQKSKQIIDDVNAVLAKHYGLDDEELDFINNYDITFRMGADEEE